MKRHLQQGSLVAFFAIVIVALAACNPIKPAPPPTPDPLVGKTVIASGLRQPRQIMYGNDGTLYVAENGIGGNSHITTTATNTVASGLSAQITAVTPDGKQAVVLAGLPSVANEPSGEDFFGAQGIYVTADALWVALGYGPELKGRALPFTANLMEFDRTTWRIKNVVDLWSAAVQNSQPSSDAPFSNPADIAAAADGSLYIADASCNCLWNWNENEGLKLLAAWTIEDNPVPTGVAIGPDGDIYVSFLSSFPFKTGSARIERWSGGTLKQTYAGLTMLTDVLVTPANRIFAVQFAEFGEKGPQAGSGKVLEITASGPKDVMTGLTGPFALALSPDNKLVVSVGAAGDTSGHGAVILVDGYR